VAEKMRGQRRVGEDERERDGWWRR
jgi:hypothetical protein